MPAHSRIAGLPLDGLSVVVPVRDEEPNVGLLAAEVAGALRGRVRFELIYVDDGSTDRTVEAVRAARGAVPEIRLLRHSAVAGQSRALVTGVRAARHEWVATLDGDGQNDPADLPKLVEAALLEDGVRLVMGNRVERRDGWLRRLQSSVANRVRAGLLGDATPDGGCGIKVLHGPTFLQLPVFDHMHRFLPALYARAGARVISVPVAHRPRLRGVSKYRLLDRLGPGAVDLLGVRWLAARYRSDLRVREED